MAQVTVELGQLIERTNFELFDFNYQFDDPTFKKEIEQTITDFYYFYEIGQETPERFKHRFKTRFLRSIDYYNKLYNTTLLSYNPLINSKMTEALDQLAKTTGSSDTTNNLDSTVTMHSEGTATLDRSANKNQDDTGTVKIDADKNTKGSDYPQQPIAGGDYLANENDEVSNQTTTNNLNTSSTEGENSTTTSDDDSTSTTDQTATTSTDSTNTTDTTYTKTIEGLTGITYQELIQKERDNLLRIPSMIIEELKPCFMLTY